MTDYIEREAAILEIQKFGVGAQDFEDYTPEQAERFVIGRLQSIPAADVALVRHGYWIDKPSGAYGKWQSWCSACGERSGIGGIEKNRHKPYCPNCGAKMDGGEEDDERKENQGTQR